MFGKNVQFIENGNESFTTNFGALLSTLIIVVVLIYSVDKLQILTSYGDSNLTEFSETEYNARRTDVDYETSKFNFAFQLNSKMKEKTVPDFSTMFDIHFQQNGGDNIQLPFH